MRFEILEIRKPIVFMNIDDLDIPHKENIQGLLEFKINSFTKLYRGRGIDKNHPNSSIEESWDKSFKMVNKFLTTIDIDSKVEIAQFMIIAHDEIIKFFVTESLVGITTLTQNIGHQLDALDRKINLTARLEEFVELNIPLGDFPPDTGQQRPQDTAEYTFREYEAKTLLSIVMLNKMLTGLFGTFIEYSRVNLDVQLKEVHCVTILTPLIKRRFFKLMNKLQNYIKHAISSNWKESPTSIFHSHTLDSLSEIITATIIIKDFVNVDLFYKNGNLLKYIYVTAKHGILTNRTAEKNPIYPRLPMSSSDGDDGNIAQLEIDSATSIKTFDTVTVVKSSINNAINKLIDQHELNTELYDECVKFYEKNIVVPTTVNKMITISEFSIAIGGGNGISFLNAKEYIRIVAITQLVMFKLGYNELAHLMTAQQGSVKMIPTDLDNRIRVTAATSDEFRNCKLKYDRSPTGADGVAWTNKINKIVQDITSYNWTYNTCVALWDIWENEEYNGKHLICSEAIVASVCSFVELAQLQGEAV